MLSEGTFLCILRPRPKVLKEAATILLSHSLSIYVFLPPELKNIGSVI